MTRPKLLLADDSVTIRKVVELTFADEGIDVTAVGDAQSAMERFVEIQPDVVLVDVGLAGTNGYQICEMIKGDDGTKHVPVMLLVGSFEPFDGDEANRVGADGFMTKPFNSIRDLVGRVSMLLKRDSGSPAVTTAESDPEAVVSEAEIGPPGPSPSVDREPDDIDQLYRSSFSEASELDELTPVPSNGGSDIDLGGLELDDDMIQASYRSDPEPEAQAQPDPVKEFDWSPEAMIPVLEAAPADTGQKELDPRDWLEDDDLVDERTSDQDSASDADDISTFETVEFSNTPAIVPIPLSQTETSSNNDELLGMFDDLDANDDEADDPSIHETVPYDIGEQPPVPDAMNYGSGVSPELIDEIVRRVVSRLSDSAVREIARVEVPRIAEKLMREALEKEETKG